MTSLLSHLSPMITSLPADQSTPSSTASWPPNDLALRAFATKPTLNYQSDLTTYLPGHFTTMQPSLYNPGFYRYV